MLTVSTSRTRLWKAAEEVLESDKCQEKLITEMVRCQGINCFPSRGDAQTDKLSGRARTPCTVWLCSGEAEAASINLCLLNTLSVCSVALGVAKGASGVSGLRRPGFIKERRPRTQEALSHPISVEVDTLPGAGDPGG